MPSDTDCQNHQDYTAESFLAAANMIAVSPESRVINSSNLTHHKFRQSDDTYEMYFKVSRLMVRAGAFGFLFGALSFLGLRALAYSPLGALIGGFHLSLAMLLVL